MPEISGLVLLTPAFSVDENDVWLPWQNIFVHNLNRLYPELRVVVIAFRYPAGKTRSVQWNGNTIHIAGNSGRGKLRSLLLWKQAWQILNTIRKQESRIALLSMFCDECALIGHLYTKRYKLSHRIWIMGQDALPKNRKVAQIRPAPAELVTISDFLQRRFELSHGIRPVNVIPIGIDPAWFPPGASKDIDLITVGSLSGLKRHELFVQIVAAVAERRPVNAVICGGGTEHHALQELIRGLGLSGRIRITGMQTHWQALELMQRSRILLHTSAYEGFGLVCTEALYAGAQVISFTKPMDMELPNWHHVAGNGAMIKKTLQLLEENKAPESVLPFHMNDTSQRIIALLNEGNDARQSGRHS
jgi:glycosyltransferase involved in cell wall biosynthesis